MRLFRTMIRIVFSAVAEGAVKMASVIGYYGETITGREYMQHYGFTSRPLAGAEGVMVREGNHIIAIASDDRRYRVHVENGEVCIYTDEGDRIHLQRNRNIAITCGAKLTVDCPLVEMTGDLLVNGDITGDQDVFDQGGTKSMSGMRQVYDNHTHPGDSGGSTGTPYQDM